MTRWLLLLFAYAVSSIASLVAQAPPAGPPVPVLAELFTAEGCNSCPPADRLLEMLVKEQSVPGVFVVGLSEHVTYWDRMGWKDPFGSQRFTARQDMYGARFKLESVFTPQIVIDGSAQMVGSDAAALRAAIAEAARAPKPALTIAADVDEKTLVATASGPGLRAGDGDATELLWAVAEDNLSVDVKRGENANRTLHHSGVVRNLVTRKLDAAALDGVREVIELKPEWQLRNLRLVVFVQSTKTRRVISAGSVAVQGGGR